MTQTYTPLNEHEKEGLRVVLERETNAGNAIGPTRAARDFLREEGGRNLPAHVVREYYDSLVDSGTVEIDSDVPSRPKYKWVGEDN